MLRGDTELISFQAERTPLSVRIRNNQRRSRARRKEYIEDLEQRVRRFERQGIEATTEVQTAARKVARENALLRTLLVAKGVSNPQIDEYLRGNPYNLDIIHKPIKAPLSASEAPIKSVIPAPSTQQPWIPESCSPGTNCCGKKSDISQNLTKLNNKSNQVLPTLAKIQPRNSNCCTPSTKICAPIDPKLEQLALPLPVRNIGQASEPCAPGATNRSLIIEKPTPQNFMDDESSCEAAANIIASMRGHGDTDKVLAELGCTSNQSCAVKNVTIFELLDR